MRRIRWHQLWNAVKTRIDTTDLAKALNGDGKVYLEGRDDYSKPEGLEGALWGRAVIVPAANLWGSIDSDQGPTINVAFIVRVEISRFNRPGFDPQINLDAAHEEIQERLDGWLPEGLTYIQPIIPIYRHSAPQMGPLWDDARGLHYTSAQYRTEVANI